jgi:hypothetical protein
MFATVCRDRLRLDLSDQELRRVYSEVAGEGVGVIGFPQFLRSVAKHAFMQHVVSTLQRQEYYFQVPEGYDYWRPTCLNYRYAGSDQPSWGEYSNIRDKVLDYKYHVRYVKSRVLWQVRLFF